MTSGLRFAGVGARLVRARSHLPFKGAHEARPYTWDAGNNPEEEAN